MAAHLLPALQRAGEKVEVVLSRDTARANALAGRYLVPHATTEVSELLHHADVIWFLTRDDVIQYWIDQVAGNLQPGHILMHAAGAVPIRVLSGVHSNAAVIYPLFTFTRESEVDFRNIPLFVEATPGATGFARRLASGISPHWYEADSETRLRLHIGAVWACNFTNYCLTVAEDLISKSPFSFREAYGPILSEVIRKAIHNGPHASQTGPALRRDTSTIETHERFLQADGDLAALYLEFTRRIQDRFPE